MSTAAPFNSEVVSQPLAHAAVTQLKPFEDPRLAWINPPPPPPNGRAVLVTSVPLPAPELMPLPAPELLVVPELVLLAPPPGVAEKVPPFPPVGTEVRDCRRTLLPAQGPHLLSYFPQILAAFSHSRQAVLQLSTKGYAVHKEEGGRTDDSDSYRHRNSFLLEY
jgi:hypothetical protein